MRFEKKQKIIIGVVIVVLLFLLFLFMDNNKNENLSTVKPIPKYKQPFYKKKYFKMLKQKHPDLSLNTYAENNSLSRKLITDNNKIINNIMDQLDSGDLTVDDVKQSFEDSYIIDSNKYVSNSANLKQLNHTTYM